MEKPKSTKIGWDWKSSPSFEELQQALEPLDIFVYEDPQTEGTDYCGFILSEGPLDEDELEEVSEELMDE
jgi:hypothetical protein